MTIITIERVILLFMLGIVLFNYPKIRNFNRLMKGLDQIPTKIAIPFNEIPTYIHGLRQLQSWISTQCYNQAQKQIKFLREEERRESLLYYQLQLFIEKKLLEEALEGK